ncbi:serine/threonine protein phosphatase [Halobacillus halophilus]|uniref:Serine/threonine protein phosphatase n=1 Tax=Halobacillus halophilus (strain ATCC 35676 / DSM 2266 / JCM 20832 / KCTC 3685 / LMG 17431 / NBRC 102448 / NCIMB 2269) TaxID=866895 RepID=I0JMB8_HALH3|nr:metallophosphoesterase family protein [Halobacillus halophilus]ASF39375.1 serine/threonine protein phosphatase [Halobacillus halophilus]CCG45288.1 serine/threonine protein phosphatase [Halobacillus halophilus DSM 2266]
MRYLVVSDIHGDIEKFEDVLQEASYNPQEDQLILLGDYVDRGPCSRDVVAKVIDLVKNDGAIAIKGNHDDLFIRSKYEKEAKKLWDLNGASTTFKSYNGNMEELRKHQEWMENNLRLYYETEEYIFVHAGLMPHIPLQEQEEQTMLWTRQTARVGLGKTVIHGHTPVRHIAYYEDQVDIDTGAVYGGKLSLLELPSHEVYTAT